MAQHRSREYGLALATHDGYFNLSNNLVGGSSIDMPTNVQPRNYLGADAAQQYEGRTTWSISISGMEYGAELDSLREANRVFANSDDCAAMYGRPGLRYIGAIYPTRIPLTQGDSDEVAVVTATLTGRRNLYQGADELVEFNTTDTEKELASGGNAVKPAGFLGTGDQRVWVVVESGDTATNATLTVSSNTVDSDTFSAAPGIYEVVNPASGFDRIKASAAIGTATSVRVVYGERMGRTR